MSRDIHKPSVYSPNDLAEPVRGLESEKTARGCTSSRRAILDVMVVIWPASTTINWKP